MNTVTPADVRMFLTSFLRERLSSEGRDLPHELTDDRDLLLSGVIDSLGLLELVTAVTEHYGRDIDFEALDPEQMTVVGPLCKYVSEQIGNG